MTHGRDFRISLPTVGSRLRARSRPVSPGELRIAGVAELTHQQLILAGSCDRPSRGGPPLAHPLARLAKHDGAALDRHLSLADQARLQQERLGDDDPLRVADATHGHVEGFHRDNNVIPMSRKVSTRPAGPPHPQLTPPSSASRAIAWWSARGACDRAGARAPPAEAGSACAAWGRRGRGG